MHKQAALFIDGSNFYHSSARFVPQGRRIDYAALADSLVKHRDCVSKRYYVGLLSDRDGSPKSRRLVDVQRRFLGRLGRRDGYVIKAGRMLYRGDRPREKGVDVKLAVDLVVGAIDELFDIAVLVSSDTDLIPAIKYVRHKGKRVEYIAVGRVSYNLRRACDVTTELTSADIAGICV